MTSSLSFDISLESPEDVAGIHTVNREAFEGGGEAHLVDQLRADCTVFISYVAKAEGIVVGHILLTPVLIEQETGAVVEGLGLGPMAVKPEFQRMGIGSELVTAALNSIRTTAVPFVVVLGHPDFYPKFGFVPASRFGVRCAFDGVPDGVFMMIILKQDRMRDVRGIARYRAEFDVVT